MQPISPIDYGKQTSLISGAMKMKDSAMKNEDDLNSTPAP